MGNNSERKNVSVQQQQQQFRVDVFLLTMRNYSQVLCFHIPTIALKDNIDLKTSAERPPNCSVKAQER